ncbi:MAG TPA: magnesium transporter [Gemmatimonadales bacterium]
MVHRPSYQSWQQLTILMAAGEVDSVREYLDGLPPGGTARTLSRLSEEDQRALLAMLGPEDAADLLAQLSEAQVVEIIEDLPVAEAARIVDALPSNEQADVLGEMEAGDAAAILARMAPEEASDARALMRHAPDSAGGIMITEFVAFQEDATVGDVVTDLRDHGERYADFEIQYVFVTDNRGRLIGVLRLRDLLLARKDESVRTLMIRAPLNLPVDSPLEAVKRFFDDHTLLGVPVTDDEGRLLGVVRRASVAEAVGERATQTFLAISGLHGEEELRTMPILHRARRRLSWLSVNILLNVVAASVIAFYQDTISAVIALAVFLPIISDMSGCSGNQAVAVSIRELTLGLIQPQEFARVIGKESVIGLVNGLVLGLLLGMVATLWQGNVYLGLVVGTALMLNTVVAVLLGGLIPLVLKAMRQDPALASGPILTTVTDMCGFFLVLSFASVMLGRLTL